MTHRAEESLRQSDLILAEDTRRTRILLDHYTIEPRSLKSFHKHNEAARTNETRAALAAGQKVSLVADSGTPLISDPGLRLVRAAIEVGAQVVPIPGPSAALAALVGSGLDAQPFTFFGFLPRSGRGRRELVTQLALFESPKRLVGTLEELAGRLGPERGVVVARELTKIHEEFVRGTLREVAAYYDEHTPLGEVVICLAAAPEASAESFVWRQRPRRPPKSSKALPASTLARWPERVRRRRRSYTRCASVTASNATAPTRSRSR
jgi:16S rRNA (cytidine1402-2'-O)-methyltransferase